MQNFIYDNKTRIIFGKDTETQVGEEVKQYGKKVLLHYGGGSIKKYGLYDRVVASLKEADLSVVELGGVKPNPRLSLVNEGIDLCKEHDIDFIIAVGGGSVIDSAKAIGFGAKYEGDVWDFFTGKEQITNTIPLGVILTIPAAGSEASTGTVITKEEGLYKRSAGSLLIRPKFAIMNPEVTYTLPDYQTSCGACDMFAHVMERYFTNESDVDFTDQLCEATMRTIIKQSKSAIEHPNDYAARAEIMWAGTIAHNGLLGTGRIEDWASHVIEHEISAIYDIAHGAGLAIVFPAWMKYVYKKDVKRFAQFANRVFGVELDLNNLERTALEGIERIKLFFKQIGLPTSLKDAGIDSDRLEEMAKKATENGPFGNFVNLDEDDVLNILKLTVE
ncbi:iron-containing alcohol dehydrogenase [Haloplasma contractile]|uniref:1-deoxy-D-xylulose-5-phosphate reductoisomerase protein n=1 Tax=Haloplasma contractile SSD-17B TaxID=1033810 RepID=U2FER8_9MOLU|nr:iron-containing alcohol dehydrogenase [Haloplasma contractile]ERJ11440.1 1-deoxy-D-xylulose-5-phosphate reductoisomerase protein [Haloplasma contractile SSD-17B]